ncbi:MAG: MBL fold metallo-hydrolase [Hormoscilla sp. SP5CHS1]|nr:MBL fold metallo-hydrolase [Hormoscilla sp. SP5CHS1]
MASTTRTTITVTVLPTKSGGRCLPYAEILPVPQGNDRELECIPYGVDQTAEGVCLLMRMGSYRLLLDCGLRDISPLREVGTQWGGLPADLAICTHAHSDHARGLLSLHQAFPQLPIYASEATTQLLPINWPEYRGDCIPLFCQALPWRTQVELRPGLTAQLFPAGHLPGAAAFLLTYRTRQRTYSIFYTGDFFLSNSRLVEGLRLEEVRGLKPDVLIIEGSYGTARHPRRRTQENQLAQRISNAIANGCSVLLPVPILGLGQELLVLLRSHHQFTGRDLDIWVDERVAAGCDAYLELLPHLPAAVQNFAQHQPLFWDERVRPRVRRLSGQESVASESPYILLVDGNGDVTEWQLPDPGPGLVLLSEDVNGSQSFPSDLAIKVETYLLSQHSDGPGTTQLIHNLRPQHVVFIHGSPSYLADLTGLEELYNRYHLHSPAPGTLVELPIGKTFLQLAPPETTYEGELLELETMVTITLPEAIAGDRRWPNFADTGLVSARWQGDELVLRGVSQRELLSGGTDPRVSLDLDCCGNCRYYRGQKCRNRASPLYEFKVTPDGFCPVFERMPL